MNGKKNVAIFHKYNYIIIIKGVLYADRIPMG